MAGAAEIFVRKLVGGFFITREQDLTLTTTQQEVVRNDPERVGYLLVVTGATQAQFAFNPGVSATQAILVAGGGGTFRTNVREDFMLPTVAMHGRVEAGTSTLHIVEVVRVSAAPTDGE